MNLEICLLPPALSFSTFPFSLFWPAWHSSKDFFLKKVKAGVLFSSVGHAGIPCAEALQRTRVWLRARVPLLCVTPPLSPCFLSHSSAILSIKPERPQKKKNLKKKLMPKLICHCCFKWCSVLWQPQLKLFRPLEITKSRMWPLLCVGCVSCWESPKLSRTTHSSSAPLSSGLST